MIQPLGEKAEAMQHLGLQCTPRFFVETFLVPWCDVVVKEQRFNEDFQKKFVSTLKEEILKLDLSKLESKKSPRTTVLVHEPSEARGEAKCAAKTCIYRGLDPLNKSAVGICSKCGNFEHFACVRIKPEQKEDILKGSIKYYCSSCFSKSPSGISCLETTGENTLRPRTGSIPVRGQGYRFRGPPTSVNTTTSLTSTTSTIDDDTDNKELDKTPSKHARIKQCDSCAYETHSVRDLDKHREENHKHTCSKCDKIFTAKNELEYHIEGDHQHACSNKTPDENLIDKVTLDNNTLHSCNKCSEEFDNTSELNKHVEHNHSHQCTSCDKYFNEEDLLKKHLENEHKFLCEHCDTTTTTVEELQNHCNKIHIFLCITSNTSFLTARERESHKEANHPADIPRSEASVSVSTSGEKTTESVALAGTDESGSVASPGSEYECILCQLNYNAKKDLVQHLELEHTQSCDICSKEFSLKSLLKNHVDSEHTFKCIICNEVRSNIEDLNEHIRQFHTFDCALCHSKFNTYNDLEVHQATYHPNWCNVCRIDLKTKLDFLKHIQDNHTYTCDVCDYTGSSVGEMEDHILDKHAHPDVDEYFKCDECDFQTKQKDIFGNHYKEKHGSKASLLVLSSLTSTYEALVNDKNKVEDELRVLKFNFERLEAIYNDSLEEVDQIKSEYEAKLIEATDKFTVSKSENEILKERVDILFKLGRSYINNSKLKNTSNNEEGNDDEIEILEEEIEVTNDNITENTNVLSGWTTNKLRGFKRVSPAAPPVKSKPGPSILKGKHEPAKWKQNTGASKPTLDPTESHSSINLESDTDAEPTSKADSTARNDTDHVHTGKYCHYFVNYGKCKYEERSGTKCKFEHKVAPMCSSGVNCSRFNCMYLHPKPNGEKSFLRKGRNFSPPINPWRTRTLG